MTASFALIAHDLKNALGSLESELEALIDNPSPAMAQSAYMHCTELRHAYLAYNVSNVKNKQMLNKLETAFVFEKQNRILVSAKQDLRSF